MNQFIGDLKSIPGMIGAAIYRPGQGVLCSNLPALFKSERLAEMARLFAKVHAAGRLNFPDLAEILISYDEAVVVGRRIAGNDLLLAFCDPSINMNLLTMSLNLAFEEYAGNRDEPVDGDATPHPASGAAQDGSESIDPQKLRSAGPLAPPLQVMNQLLSKIMGPMATIVFDDAVSLWCRDQQPATAGLPKLLEILCQEIGDDEKARTYRDLVRNQLTSKAKG